MYLGVVFISQIKGYKFSRKLEKRAKCSWDKIREKGGFFGGWNLHGIYMAIRTK